VLMITHVVAFYLLARRQTETARNLPSGAAAVEGWSNAH
jgi:hypothetical protein